MVQGVKLTPRAAERTAAAVRRVEAIPYDNTQTPPVVRPYTPVKWLKGFNPSSETITPYSLVALGPVVSIDGEERTMLLKPSDTFRESHGLTGPEPIGPLGFGGYHVETGPVSSIGSAVIGAKYGPIPGLFAAGPGYPTALECVGEVNGRMAAKVMPITRVLAKLTADSTKGSSSPVWCDICQSLIPHAPAPISGGVYRVQAINLFGSLSSATLVWLEEANGIWYIVSPAAAGSTLIRFELRGELEPGLSAPAAVLMWDADLAIYTPVLDDDDEEIIIRVADFTTPGTWRGSAPVEGGPGGFEGWCVPVTDRPYADFEDDEGEPEVTDASTLYEIVWMEQLARVIYFTLNEDLHRTVASCEVLVTKFMGGLNPTDDDLELPIEVFNPEDDSPDADPGDHRHESLEGYPGSADYDPENGKYWIRELKCPATPVPVPE